MVRILQFDEFAYLQKNKSRFSNETALLFVKLL
jgi:hypothetical protein